MCVSVLPAVRRSFRSRQFLPKQRDKPPDLPPLLYVINIFKWEKNKKWKMKNTRTTFNFFFVCHKVLPGIHRHFFSIFFFYKKILMNLLYFTCLPPFYLWMFQFIFPVPRIRFFFCNTIFFFFENSPDNRVRVYFYWNGVCVCFLWDKKKKQKSQRQFCLVS